MGFDNVSESAPVQAPVDNELSVKISHGNEIRRVTLPHASYNSLVEHTASLFALPQANIILKYEDDDGDKISMSSDMELRESLRLSKATQKILRLFVELKADPKSEGSPAIPAPAPNTTPESPANRGIYLGPQGAFGAPSPKPLPFPPSHMYPHPGFPPHPHHPPHHHPPPHHPPPGFPSADPFSHPFALPAAPSYQQAPSAPPQSFPTSQDPMQSSPASPAYARAHGMTYAAPLGSSWSYRRGMDSERGWGRGGVHHGPDHRHFRRAHFTNSFVGPQPTYNSHSFTEGTWGDSSSFDRRAHKESMRMMRDQWREMKAEMKKGGSVTEEDKRRFKEMKEEMKNEMKNMKKDALLDMKAMKLSDKKQRLVARHVEDVTIPDGTELPPNTPFIKTWKIRNEGPAWPTGSQLLFVSHKGDNLNGPERVVIKGEVLPGQEVEVSVPLITPSEPGRYVGYYRMVTPDNIKFGQRVWVSFVVTRPNEEITSTSTTNIPFVGNS